ncbi:DNA alkylation repair enzyme [Amycolatopsis mediterranei S699]|uniref:DNA alkylation repair enzyme n=2 Tax=Amycolatopsis mediterranei TaxID=33910 RepID=A0A9R0P1P6_AMYMS|nr:DNA alkylation repair protein [Amycolatopsis mediterranei]ADJ47789.1 putative DNA alkylation repair enzyme [Amycolatopsis mediterranei U32]AEK44678.1 DNA alkylation repair enzyme [Amycolatopsis mediterranei S699]AFO79500.1 DNA alkylation repair enzyme [Amycolatopsis mediterranei S699]AGT86628.1 DNA alkylation repair enzyme [Amycolatopsis mediterranei RB]KDO10293.1 DNA alkylation repair protein [Amycolatopsis mediterranei]
MSADERLVKAIRAGLADLADPAKAPAMQAYMKSAMPFRGVAKPERSALLKRVLAEHTLPDRVTFSATVLELWRTAEFREERYAAVDLSGYRAYRQWQDPDLVPVYEEMIVGGAWWDHVDELAIRRIGPILRECRPRMTPIMLAWAHDGDLWRRRTAIICQVGAKEDTDTDLLTRAIEPAIGEAEFFLRKGIGWALREYAKTAPDWVRCFVDDHPGLSGLSRREALKHIG